MSTEEEILSGGLHHIVTTQGTQPLTQEQPPVVLQEIVRTASQGQEIPMNIPPVMAHIQEEQANITITVPTSSQRNGEGGNLLGTPPSVFMGDRTKAQAFLDAIAVWRAINYKKEVMKDPYTRTTLILTFIKGENVNSWAKHQLKILNQSQENNPDPTGKPDEDWWDTFEQNFKNAFTFTALKETALAKLEKLTMSQGDLDTYIATFNRLLDEAKFSPRDKGAVEMFKRGLNVGLKINCIKRKPKPETMNEWQEAARQEHLNYLEVQQALGKNPYNVKDNILHTLRKKQSGGGGNSKTQYWKAKGPDAMEVDNTITKETKDEILEGGPHKKVTDEERAALRLLGLCYFCRGKNHLSKNCPEKPPTQGGDKRTSPGRPPTRPPTNKWNKPRVRSAETEGEQILLTREYV
jgi:Retrotransposon gag protein